MYGLSDAIMIQTNCATPIDTVAANENCIQIVAIIVSPHETAVCSVIRISVDDMMPR
jgi:hypothetical protein